MFEPEMGRVALDVPHGMTIAQIVHRALPDLQITDRGLLRIALVTPTDMITIRQDHWHLVRPNPGVHVVIRLVPGEDGLRSVLSILVSVAAIALGAGPLAGTLGAAIGTSAKFAGALITLGVNVVGSLLINALVPPTEPEEPENRYAISGWRNRLNPDGAVPVVLGRTRFAPPFAATSHTDIVGDLQYVVSLFNFGIGEVEITDIRIGDTPIDEYDEVTLELRAGLESDAHIGLYPSQIVEEGVNTELTRPLPRDDFGEIIEGDPAVEKPVIRTTGRDADGAAVILAWPAGLFYIDKKGKTKNQRVQLKIEYALIGTDVWTEVRTLDILAAKLETFYRRERFEFPYRARWQVRLTRLTDENTNTQVQDRIMFAALQTLRPEYPLNTDLPLALLGVRMQATYQLNGQLDDLNALVTRICPDWDHVSGTWIKRATRNPASLFRYILQSPGNPLAVADAQIDLELLADWHEFCRTKDLKFDGVLGEQDTTLREALAQVAAAGRATPRHDGIRWGVTIDRPQDLVVDHISPRNSWGFQVERNYFRAPDGFRIKFRNGELDYEEDERIVPWPGHTGDILLTEQLELPGKTDPDEIYREALRRAYEAIHRPDTYRVNQDGPVRVATRGDLVRVSHDVLSRVQQAGRVTAIEGSLIAIDTEVEMVEGQNYGVRFRVFSDTAPGGVPDTIGNSVLRTIKTNAGAQTLLQLTGEGPTPLLRDMVLFGPINEESAEMRVLSVENGDNMSCILRLVDAAPQIDALTDVAVIPDWTGRHGTILDPDLTTPATPRFASVQGGFAESTKVPGRIIFAVVPGHGTVPIIEFELEHRETGTTPWTTAVVPLAAAGGSIESYSYGKTVDLRLRARSVGGVYSAWSDVVTFEIGYLDGQAPGAGDLAAVSVTGGRGNATISIATSPTSVATQVDIFRVPTGVDLDEDLHRVGTPLLVSTVQTAIYIDGDSTRPNLAGSWTTGTNWTLSGQAYQHSPGAAGSIHQPFEATPGQTFRVSFEVISRTAGTVRPRLTGGTTVNGEAVNDIARHHDTLSAQTGNATFELLADVDFDGTIGGIVIFEPSAASVPQGTYDYYIRPANDVGATGPMSGPFTTLIL
ncbi:host specificity factor TipJ family phage tail protein [Oceaniglobus trochenteri]|uniref:host specificity factor TipJ family phage tail protein n=1 Tax=Oceaniglobus trochenteri TaxID=2763260 RepID=UPI001D0008C0|nr:host specificity factor TipJ family phage tail protein [Oceaniglobus trochenteri]